MLGLGRTGPILLVRTEFRTGATFSRSVVSDDGAPEFGIDLGVGHLLDEGVDHRLASSLDELDASDHEGAAAADAASLVTVFEADTGWYDTVPWKRFRANRTFRSSEEATGSYYPAFEPETVPADSARVLVAPDNAEREIVGKLHTAEESILVKQVGIGDREQPFLEATIEAARRGVEVRILLADVWYVRDENRELAAWLNELADEEGLDLEVRLAEPRGRYEKIHAKGVVIDEERVLVGSVNWNNHSIRQNREVVVALEGDEVGAYYAEVFMADWRGGRWSVPVGVPVAVLLVGLGAGVAARRVEWTDDLEPVDWDEGVVCEKNTD